MRSVNRLFRGLGLVGVVALAMACQTTEREDGDEGSGPEIGKSGQDIQASLDALPAASVADVDDNGVPTFVAGNLGAAQVGSLKESDVQNVLQAVAPAFRAKVGQLVFKGAFTDSIGDTHFKFAQTKNGHPVLDGELLVHTRKGVVYAVNGSARDDLAAPTSATVAPNAAISAAQGISASSVIGANAVADKELFYLRNNDKLDLVYGVEVTGTEADGTPVRDTVYVNANDGSVAMRVKHIHTAKNRELHNLNHGTSLPGPVARTEGQAPNADATVNINYDLLGTVWDVYKNDFGRDSFDGAGAKLISSVHYSNNYVNAFWNSTQMVYGDGDGVQASNLAHSLDVTGHELTHAVTERTSNLTYSGQSGGLNEALSDIFGNYIEWVKEGRTNPPNKLTTWTVGDDCWTPGTAGDGLRYMYDPKKDSRSLDWAPDFTSGTDVHYSSGIPNLAFYLLSVGGTHPRGKSTINVPAIGIEKAAQVFFRANAAPIFTSGTTFAQAKTATAQAAQQLGYTTAEIDSVNKAWEAVGVGATTPPPTTTPLTNGTPVTGLSGATGSTKNYSLAVPAGATGLKFTITGGSDADADLYVKFGSLPTTSSYDCRPYLNGNNETCNINPAKVGTYYVVVRGYSAYSGVTLTGSHQ